MQVSLGRQPRTTLYAEISQTIRMMIEDGVWQPGGRLPPLSQLAAEFGCSRATIREALGALRGQGLVEFRHGDGTFVRTAALDMWMEPLEAALLLGAGHVKALIELLTSLIAGAVSFTAASSAEVDLSGLRSALFQVECSSDVAEEAVAAELSFYLALAECLGNDLLANSLRVLQEALRSCIRLARQAGVHGTDQCRQLFDAIALQQPQAAREAAFRHGELWSSVIAQQRRSSAPKNARP